MINNPYMFGSNMTPQQRLSFMENQYPHLTQQQVAMSIQQPQQIQQAQIQQPTVPTNKIYSVNSLQEAQNAQIPMDGSVSYFAFGDNILARNWSFATGKIENVIFKKIIENEEPIKTEEKIDRLKVIEEKIDTLITQSKYPINKNKGAKQDVE